MLNTYLKASPPSKLILIEDCLEEKGLPLVYFLNEHHQKLNNEVKYFLFEGNFEKIKSDLTASNIKCFDCTRTFQDVEKMFMKELTPNSVLIIDSLVQVLSMIGLARTCKFLNNLMREIKDNQQIITILHTDLLKNKKNLVPYFEGLATLSLAFDVNNSEVHYTYKKAGGRVFKKIETYKFEQNQFTTEELKKPNIAELVEEKINTVCPENLSTFKIGLTEADKESKDNLTLPYLPKETDSAENIIYKFDDEDEWDEEDPDDDLDL